MRYGCLCVCNRYTSWYCWQLVHTYRVPSVMPTQLPTWKSTCPGIQVLEQHVTFSSTSTRECSMWPLKLSMLYVASQLCYRLISCWPTVMTTFVAWLAPLLRACPTTAHYHTALLRFVCTFYKYWTVCTSPTIRLVNFRPRFLFAAYSHYYVLFCIL